MQSDVLCLLAVLLSVFHDGQSRSGCSEKLIFVLFTCYHVMKTAVTQ